MTSSTAPLRALRRSTVLRSSVSRSVVRRSVVAAGLAGSVLAGCLGSSGSPAAASDPVQGFWQVGAPAVQPAGSGTTRSVVVAAGRSYLVTLRLDAPAGARQRALTAELEGVPVRVPAFSGSTTVQRVVPVRDSSLDVSLSGTWNLPAVGALSATPAGARLAERAVRVPVTTTGSSPTSGWQRVYRNDFRDLRDVNAFQSSPATNALAKPSDTSNSALQKPTVRADVSTASDPAAEDGKALALQTRRTPYLLPTGTGTGWTNGRMSLSGQDQAPPVRIRARVRFTASAYTKSAVMWWPSAGGWPWEVDFAEEFGGSLSSDWGKRALVTNRWHSDLDGDGMAVEQLVKDTHVDATQYHVYDLFITPGRMWMELDGVKQLETTDPRWIPRGKGFFAVGKASTGRRDLTTRTDDTVAIDYVEIFRPAGA